jgi:hypothetical protein
VSPPNRSLSADIGSKHSWPIRSATLGALTSAYSTRSFASPLPESATAYIARRVSSAVFYRLHVIDHVARAHGRRGGSGRGTRGRAGLRYLPHEQMLVQQPMPLATVDNTDRRRQNQ